MQKESTSYTLEEVAPLVFAYVHESGTWGVNNAGLIASGRSALLVDTLFDMARTRRMLQEMRDALGDGVTVETVVNTHENGDHWYGNGHFYDCDIIASKLTAEEMKALPPKLMNALMVLCRVSVKLGPVRKLLGSILSPLGSGVVGAVVQAAPYLMSIFGQFDFADVTPVYPNKTFEGEMVVPVGEKTVQLIELGPAHTRSDVVVFEPESRTLFAGDLLFIGGHPLVWVGPFSNWITACDRMMALEPKVVVPGHGPLTDTAGIAHFKAYLVHMDKEIRRCHSEGLTAAAAVRALDLGPFAHLNDKERIVVNVETLYRELNGMPGPASIVPFFPKMAALLRETAASPSP